MFQLTLQITDETIEQALLRLAQQRSSEVSEVIMMAIQDFITHNEPLNYKKLDPLVHSTVINYPVTDENLDDVKPFANVKDAAYYVNTLRQQTWNRNA
ncbi:hypothetical protein BGP_1866 [Beggiatoa sp. PS]|nr:hypothetical protein BGP_1866 [Beggiatoa sp. PS]